MLTRLSAQTLPWATDWDALFGRAAPLILEIGFGYGVFLVHLAQTHPHANVVGVEVANRCLNAAESAIRRLAVTNVRVIHARAETALHHLFRPNTLAQVHINFPDPWFKSGHRHRRLMQPDTLAALASRMRQGAPLYLATDILDYAQMSADLLAQSPHFANALPDRWTTEPPAGRVTTKYEQKARREGRTPMYFIHLRTAHPAPLIPVLEELPMAHLVFSSPLTLDDMFAAFQPSQWQAGERHLSLLAVYRGRGSLLFEANASEPTIDQRFAITLLPKDEGRCTLQVSSLGHPRMTSGVHQIMWALGRWLLSLHPDAILIDSKLQADEMES